MAQAETSFAGTPSIDTARIRASVEAVAIPVGALLASAIIFSVFLALLGKSPVQFFELVWRGGFGTSFSFQNTLQRAAPLILTGLAFAIPARIGLVMIGAEGALVIGGFAAAAIAIPLVSAAAPVSLTMVLMVLAAMVAGGAWNAIAGWLKHSRGVNETISTLLLTYIAIAIMNFFVEGALRDPASQNKPSTMPIGKDYMVGSIPGFDVHWGLVFGLLLAVALQILMSRTTFGFAARVTGGNPRAALAQGLPVGTLIVVCSVIRRLRRARRLFRSGRHSWPGQCLAGRGLRLHRNPGGISGAAQSADDRSGGDHVRRHRSLGRADPAPHGHA